jgi:hypothetical protein
LLFFLQKTKLINEKIPCYLPAEAANSPETVELQVQEEALDTVVAEPEDQTKGGELIRTETQEEFPEIEKVGQEEDIPYVESEAVLGEFNTDANLKSVDQYTENAAVSTRLSSLISYLVSWTLVNSSLLLYNGRGMGPRDGN